MIVNFPEKNMAQHQHHDKGILGQLQDLTKPLQESFKGLRKLADDALEVAKHLSTGKNLPGARHQRETGKLLVDRKSNFEEIGLPLLGKKK